MEHCAFHPELETLLSCAHCGRPICADCAVHTAVGTRCKVCAVSDQSTAASAPEPSPKSKRLMPTQRTMSRFAAGLLVTVLANLLLAPFVLLPALAASVGAALWRHLNEWPRLLGGFIYFMIAWFAVVPAVLSLDQNKNLVDIRAHPPGIGAGFFLLATSLLMIPFLWKPAQRCSRQLIEEGRGFAAGVTVGSALSATGVSIMAAVMITLLSI